ncbi:MAG: hypothetical protein NTW29_22270 [Bacteroidetes bacterium]|nr:hypothetical protein [Bacteroidota bacterium]
MTVGMVKCFLAGGKTAFRSWDGQIEQLEYKSIKDRYEQVSQKLVEQKTESALMESNPYEYLDFAMQLLQHLPKYYESANVEIKRQLVGSIFSEKLVFDKNAYRTPKRVEAFSLICNTAKDLRAAETKMGKSQK